MKHIYDKDIEGALKKILGLFRLIEERAVGIELFEMILRYTFSSTEVNIEEIKEIIDSEDVEKGGEILMTTAEILIEKGIKKGIEQRMEQGIIEGKQDFLIEQMETKFGAIENEYREKIKGCKDMNKLKNAIKKILTSNSIEELLNTL